MRIHLVWLYPDGDKILDRLARYLTDGNGWSLSDRPEGRAELNYSLVYVDFAQRFSDWRKTPWAAYFSHFEPDVPYKKFWWEMASPLVRIKTVTAAQYGAILPGHVVKVTPPVDPMFEIRDRKANKVPRIGVSGFVAPGGRKGERLVAQLAGDLEGQEEVVASGQGWPARKVNDKLSGLPGFYNSLDLYLCTSLIEGIPMPPLEALACGIPVVIPEGVGMLDELTGPGIYRYQVGDYAGLKQAAELALAERSALDREALRRVGSGFTPAAWCRSHQEGFEQVLSGQPAQSVRAEQHIHAAVSTDRHGSRGVYYVAYGDPARKCATGAIASFKQFLPEIPVALVSDRPLGCEDVFIQHPDADIGGRLAKVKIYDLAPAEWQYVAYLDSDTEVIAAERLLWQVVEDGWDMVICKNPERFHVAREMRRSDNGDECDQTFQLLGTDEVMQLNGGVFAFARNERTAAFFHCWESEWRRWGKRDQGALLRALWQHPVKMYVLGQEWNNIVRYPGTTPAWLNHTPMVARRWRGVIDHPLTSPEAWAAVQAFERNGGK
jgi:hypothetical protein